MRRHGLRRDFDPLTAQNLIPFLREFQFLQCRVNAHAPLPERIKRGAWS
jgi:hypothetical protein